jgi:hypothetical protein
MKSAPYTKTEAEIKCSEYQYLVGQQFREGLCATIDCVVVAPFDEENKNRFMVYFLLFNDASMALSHDYNGKLFDILIIAKSDDQMEMVHDNLYSWLTKYKGYNSNGDINSIASEASTQAYATSI